MVDSHKRNAKLSDSQLNNLPHKLLLTKIQTTRLRNAIENNMSTDIRLSKAQISINNSIWRISW